MNTIDKIFNFAEAIAKEDEEKMAYLNSWERYIKPLFKQHTGYNFDISYVSMYKKEWKTWLDSKRKEFDNLYYN